jgi:cysteine-rich repeat protein
MRFNLLRRGLLLLCLLAAPAARAQNVGFQLNRYEPTAAGEWSFSVDHPWYTSTRHFAAGLTLNYAHNPLVYGLRADNGDFTQTQVVIRHHLLFHVDAAVALFDRLNVSFTLPVTVLERGETVGAVVPLDLGALGDPRLGLMVRLYGQPDASPFSLSLGGSLWFPVGAADERAGDSGVRVLPRLVAGGLWRKLRWSAIAGFYYRPAAVVAPDLSDPRGGTIGSALQLGGLIQYADLQRRFAIGPELLMHTTVNDGNAFKRDYTNLEMLLGGHYNIAGQVQTGLAVGLGTLRDPGTPDFRLLFRLAYAPLGKTERPAKCPACEVCPKCEAPPPPPAPVCGNGKVETGEQCDDGNRVSGDLCSAQCTVEAPPPPPKPCRKLDLKNRKITFEPDQAVVKSRRFGRANELILEDIVKQISELPDNKIVIRIEGHTSEEGPNQKGVRGKSKAFLDWAKQPHEDQAWQNDWSMVWGGGLAPSEDDRARLWYNQWLSQERADAVKKWLEAHGVTKTLEAVGYGPRRPVPPPKSPESAAERAERREDNRRVEFVIIQDSCQADPVQQR